MRIPTLAFPLLLAMLPWQSAHAGPIYKWVDSAGNVYVASEVRRCFNIDLIPEVKFVGECPTEQS